MKNRTLVALPVLVLLGFLAVKPPVIGNETKSMVNGMANVSPNVEVMETPAHSKKIESNSSPSTAQESTSASPLTAGLSPGKTSKELSRVPPATESAPLVAPPVIRGDDDDDDDDDHDRRHHDDD